MKKVIELCLKVEEHRICSLIEENETESEKRSNSFSMVLLSLYLKGIFYGIWIFPRKWRWEKISTCKGIVVVRARTARSDIMISLSRSRSTVKLLICPCFWLVRWFHTWLVTWKCNCFMCVFCFFPLCVLCTCNATILLNYQYAPFNVCVRNKHAHLINFLSLTTSYHIHRLKKIITNNFYNLYCLLVKIIKI
jgi:hypothetical protein